MSQQPQQQMNFQSKQASQLLLNQTNTAHLNLLNSLLNNTTSRVVRTSETSANQTSDETNKLFEAMQFIKHLRHSDNEVIKSNN